MFNVTCEICMFIVSFDDSRDVMIVCVQTNLVNRLFIDENFKAICQSAPIPFVFRSNEPPPRLCCKIFEQNCSNNFG